MGIDCVAANDGKTALRLFRKTALEFDLVLTDLVLPDVGGQALLTEIYQQTPHQRVIIISAFIDAKSQTEFLDQRLKHKPWLTLAKPFKLQELKSIVASSLETPAVNPRSAVRHNRLRPSL
jgi:DNA-binding NtrC family response regulator